MTKTSRILIGGLIAMTIIALVLAGMLYIEKGKNSLPPPKGVINIDWKTQALQLPNKESTVIHFGSQKVDGCHTRVIYHEGRLTFANTGSCLPISTMQLPETKTDQ